VSETRALTCIACPIGCALTLTHEGRAVVEVRGASCDRGAKYAAQEIADPRRQLSTTVPIEGARATRLPVKVSQPIPRDRVLEAARQIHGIRAHAPVRCGQVLLQDLLGEPGISVVATRTMEAIR
jgi:CxxC motif-containing protein